jgi:hypothetical protein
MEFGVNPGLRAILAPGKDCRLRGRRKIVVDHHLLPQWLPLGSLQISRTTSKMSVLAVALQAFWGF